MNKSKGSPFNTDIMGDESNLVAGGSVASTDLVFTIKKLTDNTTQLHTSSQITVFYIKVIHLFRSKIRLTLFEKR